MGEGNTRVGKGYRIEEIAARLGFVGASAGEGIDRSARRGI